MAGNASGSAVSTEREVYVEQTAEEFEAEFGLEGNPGLMEEDGEGGEIDEGAIEAAADRLIAMDGDEDNIARLERLERERAEAEGEEEEEEAEEAEEEVEEEEEAEEEEGEEEGEGEDNPVVQSVRAMKPEAAQALLDALISEHGDALRFRLRANGEELELPWGKLRDDAAGYHGVRAENQRLAQQVQEIQQERTRIEGLYKEVEDLFGQVQAQRQQLVGMVRENPRDFVRGLLMRYSTPEFLTGLRDELEDALDTIERNPELFDLRREFGEVKDLLMGLASGGQGAREGASGQGAGQTQQETQQQIPEDFGFVPGDGYPKAYAALAWRAAAAAAKAVGLDPDKVVDAWDEGGRQEPLEAVVQKMARERFAETTKVDTARRRGKKRRVKGTRSGVRVPMNNPAARGTPRWDDIEKEVAQAIRAAQQ